MVCPGTQHDLIRLILQQMPARRRPSDCQFVLFCVATEAVVGISYQYGCEAGLEPRAIHGTSSRAPSVGTSREATAPRRADERGQGNSHGTPRRVARIGSDVRRVDGSVGHNATSHSCGDRRSSHGCSYLGWWRWTINPSRTMSSSR